MNHNDYWMIMSALRLLKEYAGQALNPTCERYGVTAVQAHLLVSLHFDGPQPAGQLARTCCMAGGNASVMCKRLEGMGLLSRHRHPGDERLVIITLTPKGEQVVRTILDEMEAQFARLPLELDAREAEMLGVGIGRLDALLKESAATRAAMEETE